MTTTMEEANATLRAAVAERLASTPADDPKMVGYPPTNAYTLADFGSPAERKKRQDSLQENYAEWEPPTYARQTGDGVPGSRPTVAEQTLQSALEAVRDRHGKYGPPVEHFARTAALVNAAFGTSFTPADWALVMVLDKVARQRGSVGGHDDAAIDIAGYAACHEECRSRG